MALRRALFASVLASTMLTSAAHAQIATSADILAGIGSPESVEAGVEAALEFCGSSGLSCSDEIVTDAIQAFFPEATLEDVQTAIADTIDVGDIQPAAGPGADDGQVDEADAGSLSDDIDGGLSEANQAGLDDDVFPDEEETIAETAEDEGGSPTG